MCGVQGRVCEDRPHGMSGRGGGKHHREAAEKGKTQRSNVRSICNRGGCEGDSTRRLNEIGTKSGERLKKNQQRGDE